MEFHHAALLVLVVAAALDLLVGVANDAVNFLNSAIGARAARLRTLLWLASAGVILGALTSSGMMEVARSGVFQPAQYNFHEVMLVFLAVMITDVILLDAFNTIGLPTSTTVSVVFELLGAATMIALLSIGARGLPLSALGDYINGAGAVRIISGIVLSVGIAFTAGVLVQWLARLAFTFAPERRLWLRRAWAGLALSVISYFLLIKGLKGAAIVPEALSQALAAQPLLVFSVLIPAATALSWAAERSFQLEPLRLTVLAGTFALATAFAGNDLVNFIGVPLAGLAAHQLWQASGASPEGLSMEALAGRVPTPTWLLLLAGGLMVATLHLSNKARSVTETEVSLGRQGSGEEKFRPGPLSRGLLRFWLGLYGVLKPLVPDFLRAHVARRFAPPATVPGLEAPAFDMLRASVNLTVASCLIAVATTMKLPLSTTFVTFMVAMGSSLADRAWGRDSAAYRVAGVGRVLGGWFATALIAAGTSALIALWLWTWAGFGLLTAVAVAVLSLLGTSRWFQRRARLQARAAQTPYLQPERARQVLAQSSAWLLAAAQAIGGALPRALRRAAQDERVLGQSLTTRALEYAVERGPEAAPLLHQMHQAEQGLIEGVARISAALETHHLNLHAPFTPDQEQRLVAAFSTVGQGLPQLERESLSSERRLAWLKQTRAALRRAAEEELRALRQDHRVGPHRGHRLALLVFAELESLATAAVELSGLREGLEALARSPRASTLTPAARPAPPPPSTVSFPAPTVAGPLH